MFYTRVWEFLICAHLFLIFPESIETLGIPYFAFWPTCFMDSIFWICLTWLLCFVIFMFLFVFISHFVFSCFSVFDFKKCLLNFARFCQELGPGSVTIGFSAKNYIGYSNSRPNWRQESVFYEHLIVFPRSPSIHWAFLKKNNEFS